MSELPVNKQKLNFFIHSESPHNKLNYVYNQAIAENEVIYTFSMKNALLLSIANKPMGNYVEIINNLNPDGVIKIKEDSKRISEKIRVLCWKINEKTKKLRRSGSIFLRKEHRMISLKGRERKKRTYTKVNEEFWSKGKGDLTKQIKRGCVSSQKADTEEDTGSNRTVDSQEASSNGKRKKTKSQVQSKKKRCTKK